MLPPPQAIHCSKAMQYKLLRLFLAPLSLGQSLLLLKSYQSPQQAVLASGTEPQPVKLKAIRRSSGYHPDGSLPQGTPAHCGLLEPPPTAYFYIYANQRVRIVTNWLLAGLSFWLPLKLIARLCPAMPQKTRLHIGAIAVIVPADPAHVRARTMT